MVSKIKLNEKEREYVEKRFNRKMKVITPANIVKEMYNKLLYPEALNTTYVFAEQSIYMNLPGGQRKTIDIPSY